jgi:hypothetical protein
MGANVSSNKIGNVLNFQLVQDLKLTGRVFHDLIII